MHKTIISFILAALGIFGFIKVLESNERFSCDGSIIVVESGNTVWDIVQEHCTGNKDGAMSSIIEQIGSVNLQPGQTFTLPGK
jgi:hypothetical protein